MYICKSSNPRFSCDYLRGRWSDTYTQPTPAVSLPNNSIPTKTRIKTVLWVFGYCSFVQTPVGHFGCTLFPARTRALAHQAPTQLNPISPRISPERWRQGALCIRTLPILPQVRVRTQEEVRIHGSGHIFFIFVAKLQASCCCPNFPLL